MKLFVVQDTRNFQQCRLREGDSGGCSDTECHFIVTMALGLLAFPVLLLSIYVYQQSVNLDPEGYVTDLRVSYRQGVHL